MESHRVFADTAVDDLKSKIANQNARLTTIEKEIASYQLELTKVGSQKNTLQKAINQLTLEQKKVQADIQYTENKIGATNLELSKIDLEIGNTQELITLNENAISETLRRLNETDDNAVLVTLLNYNTFSDFWDQIDQLQQVRRVISDQVKSLVSQRILLQSKRDESTKKRNELFSLKGQYTDQNVVLKTNTTEKNKLLSATKNQESNYQKLLKDRKAAREAIEKELRDYESKLKFILDPSSIPPKGTVAFNWPFPNPIITQLFGGTEFAKQNMALYGHRAYHPGIDISAHVGTLIRAPLAGVVRATGDTDLVPGCYSWGRWTLIDHANGLSTLYAHQSVIKVTPGQRVNTGDVIGYTGNTGFTTGPHLHFTVYVQAGVTIHKFSEIKSVTSCGPATTPVAATDAYLDPLDYLSKDYTTSL